MTPKEMRDAAEMLESFCMIRGHRFRDQPLVNLSTNLREQADTMEPKTVPDLSHEALEPPPAPNVWDRCKEFAIAAGHDPHDHGHGDVAALVLTQLLYHLQDHDHYGDDHALFRPLCKKRGEGIEVLLKKKETPETVESCAKRLNGQSVTIVAKATGDRLHHVVSFREIAAAILNEHNVPINRIRYPKGQAGFFELGVWNVTVFIGPDHQANVNVWIVKEAK